MSVLARGVMFAAIVLLGVVACQPATGPTSPAASTSTSGASSASPSSESSPPSEAAPSLLAGQTDTAWGRIWDSLPADFPTYPGSSPAEATSGPASGVYVVPQTGTIDAMRIADFTRSKLELASYSTEALNGPFEDGSYVLDSIGPAPGCRVQVSIAPLGGLTTVTVLYGAGCPKP